MRGNTTSSVATETTSAALPAMEDVSVGEVLAVDETEESSLLGIKISADDATDAASETDVIRGDSPAKNVFCSTWGELQLYRSEKPGATNAFA
mmetsp:Transcript_18429/g.27492  ORF Transcript_18429/g.27492 Transcript_18429/m.27492 type:complete len:93 (+) Transcript_18429:2174-2452(+)